jgi:hypothetical protein
MNQYSKPLVIGLMIVGLIGLSGLSISAMARNQTDGNQTGGSSDNMTAGGGNRRSAFQFNPWTAKA